MLKAPEGFFENIPDTSAFFSNPRIIQRNLNLRGRFADYDGKTELQEIGGKYYLTDYDRKNKIISSRPINIDNIVAYNPDGSPRNPDDMAVEALKIQGSKALTDAGLGALGVGSTIFGAGKFKLPERIYNVAKKIPGAVKSLFYGPKTKTFNIPPSIIRGERVPGGTVTGTFGQGFTPFGQATIFGVPTVGGILGAVDAATTSEAEQIEDVIESLENPKVLEYALNTLNDPDSTQEEKDAAEQTIRSVATQTDTNNEAITEALASIAPAPTPALTPTPAPTPEPGTGTETEPAPEPTPEPTPPPKRLILPLAISASQATANSLSNFFSSDKFLSALRNIGSALVREGRFGAGLAAGSADFAEEQEAKRLLAEAQQAELNKILFEKGLKGDDMSFEDISKVADQGVQLNEYIKNFEGANASVGIMNDVIALFEEAETKGVNVTGVRGRLSRLSDEASAFLNLGGEPGTATRIKSMIEVVKNKQIREILGESGRTISDLDRRIVDKVFGEIDLTTKPDIALKKLRDAREQLKSSARQYQRDIRTSGNALALPQAGVLGETYISEYSDLINDILKIDVDKLDVVGYNPEIGARVVKITLRGE